MQERLLVPCLMPYNPMCTQQSYSIKGFIYEDFSRQTMEKLLIDDYFYLLLIKLSARGICLEAETLSFFVVYIDLNA